MTATRPGPPASGAVPVKTKMNNEASVQPGPARVPRGRFGLSRLDRRGRFRPAAASARAFVDNVLPCGVRAYRGTPPGGGTPRHRAPGSLTGDCPNARQRAQTTENHQMTALQGQCAGGQCVQRECVHRQRVQRQSPGGRGAGDLSQGGPGRSGGARGAVPAAGAGAVPAADGPARAGRAVPGGEPGPGVRLAGILPAAQERRQRRQGRRPPVRPGTVRPGQCDQRHWPGITPRIVTATVLGRRDDGTAAGGADGGGQAVAAAATRGCRGRRGRRPAGVPGRVPPRTSRKPRRAGNGTQEAPATASGHGPVAAGPGAVPGMAMARRTGKTRTPTRPRRGGTMTAAADGRWSRRLDEGRPGRQRAPARRSAAAVRPTAPTRQPDDPPDTVVHVREPNGSQSGSSSMTSARSGDRPGRGQEAAAPRGPGDRPAPAADRTESEFLARRESVERSMGRAPRARTAPRSRSRGRRAGRALRQSGPATQSYVRQRLPGQGPERAAVDGSGRSVDIRQRAQPVLYAGEVNFDVTDGGPAQGIRSALKARQSLLVQ